MKGLRVLELSEALNVDSNDLLAVCAILQCKASSRLSMLTFKECKLINTRIILTGQHKEMTNQVMKLFNLKEDINLEIMKSKM